MAWSDANARRADTLRGGARQRRNARIKQRDGYTCRACGGARCGNRQLEVDHIDGDRTNETDANLQTLGHACHKAKTQAEAARARAKRTTARHPERHPGLT